MVVMISDEKIDKDAERSAKAQVPPLTKTKLGTFIMRRALCMTDEELMAWISEKPEVFEA